MIPYTACDSPAQAKRLMTDKDPKALGGDSLIDGIADWLMTQALREIDLEPLLRGCCERLYAAGVPLRRVHVSFRTLHPLFHGMGLTWQRGQGVASERYSVSNLGTAESHTRGHPEFPEQFVQSPLYHMIESRIPYLRRRLAGAEALVDFSVLEEFRDAGLTDYLGFTVSFSDAALDGIGGSWATDRPSGFSARDIQSLLRIQRRLGVAFKVHLREQIARNVLTAYLGPKTGRRVLDGQIRRGDGETIHAVVWYSDLRESTRLAGSLPQDAFFDLLNNYFECTAGAVLEAGGEVLLLIGDAVLAIFPIAEPGEEANSCAAALGAARDAEARLARINRESAGLDLGRAPLAFGLALHIGDVIYGNIGVPERLQFTVIGPTVNEVARLESLTKDLRRPVLVSADFARCLPLAWDPLGTHSLKGVDGPREVFAPPRPTSPGAVA